MDRLTPIGGLKTFAFIRRMSRSSLSVHPNHIFKPSLTTSINTVG